VKNFRFTSNLLAAALLALLFTSVSSATNTRSYVSHLGLDANTCLVSSPCRTFAGAILKTAADGEINCLDAGEYGDGTPLTITHGITIDCGGTFGSITGPQGANAVFINAGSSDVVTLRNLSIYGLNGFINGVGIFYGAAHSVHVENVRVFLILASSSCIVVNTTAASLMTIENASLSDCNTGIFVGSTSGNAVVNVNNTRITSIVNGILPWQNAKVTVTHSLIANGQLSGGAGISQAQTGSQVLITDSTIASMGIALQSSPGNFLGASGCTFTNNGTIYNQGGGQIYTGGDNPVFGNGASGSTSGALPKL
jgi:hypothetical protein